MNDNFFENRQTHVSANDGNWHHICATWENGGGAWRFYKDGVCYAKGINLKKGHTIRSGGSLVLAQEQDSGGFQAHQSFQGLLTDVNVWSTVLSDAVIADLAESCFSSEGNVYRWNDFIYGVKGEARIVIPSCCEGN